MIPTAPPVCKQCKNNFCQLDDEVFARKHLSPSAQVHYHLLQQLARDLIAKRRAERQQKPDLYEEAR